MRVLIVEDDVALGVFLAKGLKLEGHEVDLVGDGRTGLDRAKAHHPDLMVLDLSLPQLDGMQVLEAMQGSFLETSILVLTGRNEVQDRVACLNLGADDCLLKPFSYNELTARCRALLRRREQFSDPLLRIRDLELNRMERTVSRSGQRVDLTVKEFALLEYLMQARGRVCLRTELLRDVWQASPSAGTNVVDVYVNYLRKKLGAVKRSEGDNAGESDRIIDTVRGEGYAIAATSAAQGTAERKPMARVLPERRGLPAWTSGGLAHA
jgi:DNA-binding response OmpR family regulator